MKDDKDKGSKTSYNGRFQQDVLCHMQIVRNQQ